MYPGPDLPKNPTARQRLEHRLAVERWQVSEAARIRAQRGILDGTARWMRRRLIRAMLGRAWDLLEGANPEAADALLEFVPEADAEALLRAYFEDE